MATQATALAASEHAAITKALSYRGEINALHREAMKSGNEMMRNAIRCGELLEEVKKVLKVAKSTTFEKWLEGNVDFSAQSARSYMRLANDLGALGKTKAAFVLKNADSISEARRLISAALPEPEEKEPPMPTPKPVQQPAVQEVKAALKLAEPTFVKPVAKPEPEVQDCPEPCEPEAPDERSMEPEVQTPEEPRHHSPTPWTCKHYGKTIGEQPEWTSGIFDANGMPLSSLYDQRANTEHIVACVNAMAGVQDPETFVGTE